MGKKKKVEKNLGTSQEGCNSIESFAQSMANLAEVFPGSKVYINSAPDEYDCCVPVRVRVFLGRDGDKSKIIIESA